MSVESNRAYDKYKRNKEARAFYKSKAWEKCRLFILIRDNYLCQPCIRKGKLSTANTVHHIKPLEDYPELALDADNLESICPSCHNKEHPEKGTGREMPITPKKAHVIISKANEEAF